MKINENERACLESLAYNSTPDEMFIGFFHIMSDTRFDRKLVRRSVRSLARKGLAKYARGLTDPENGEVAGAGYAATIEGRDMIIKKCEECFEEIGDGCECPNNGETKDESLPDTSL